ncbi:hypothetical protein [Rheinheimera sp.]|uniref:hypothetical protein n=1 Tax=Rheinheimera sp. TaxID=1869214 RepID=UPI004048DECB
MQEFTQTGSTITRELTHLSLSDFEAHVLPDGYQFLCSSTRKAYDATWINKVLKTLISYCEGDLVTIKCPDDSAFISEQWRYVDFCTLG